MRIIGKKDFLPTICIMYTILSVGKIVLEAIFQNIFGNYQENLLAMLLFSALGTLVLSQHYRLERIPLVVVIAGQYVVLVAAVMLFTWCNGFWEKLSEHAYRDMFWSFTIPYVIAAAVYYMTLYFEVKKADRLLRDIREGGKEK